MVNKQEISTVFLRLFTRDLILHNLKIKINDISNIEKIKSKVNTEGLGELKQSMFTENIKKELAEIPPIEIERKKEILSEIKKRDLTAIPNLLNQFEKPKPLLNPIPFPRLPTKNNLPLRRPSLQKVVPNVNLKPQVLVAKTSVPSQFQPSINEVKIELGMPKIDEIISDPNVQTIECPGPNKNVLIYKNGKIFPSKLSLTNDEINNLMKSVSEKTRIPLMSGVFKAAYGDLIITAVMSEFVGTRFILQKKARIPPSR